MWEAQAKFLDGEDIGMKDSVGQKYEGDPELEFSQVMKDANLMVDTFSSADL